LRFTRAAAAYLVACPQCDEPPQSFSSAARTIGFRLYVHDEPPEALPEALASALSLPSAVDPT